MRKKLTLKIKAVSNLKVLLKSSIDHTQIKEKIRHDVNFIHGPVIISIKKKKKKGI